MPIEFFLNFPWHFQRLLSFQHYKINNHKNFSLFRLLLFLHLSSRKLPLNLHPRLFLLKKRVNTSDIIFSLISDVLLYQKQANIKLQAISATYHIKTKTLAFSEHMSDIVFFLISDVLTYQRISNSKYQISGSKCHISYQNKASAFSEHISDITFFSCQTY